MMKLLSVIALIILAVGAITTYFSGRISGCLFKGDERDAANDNLKVKFGGLIIALVGASALFLLKK